MLWKVVVLAVLAWSTIAHAVLPASDLFNAATISASWTQVTWEASTVVVRAGNTSVGADGTSEGIMFWNADTQQATTNYACVRIAALSASNYAGVALAVSDAAGTADDESIEVYVASGDWAIDGFIDGNYVSPAANGTGSTPTFVVGDYLGLERQAALTFRAFRAASATPTTWTAIGGGTAVFTGTLVNPGRAGVFFYNSTTSADDQWEAGDGNPMSGTWTGGACGTNSGAAWTPPRRIFQLQAPLPEDRFFVRPARMVYPQ